MKSKRFRGIAAVLAVALAGLLAWPALVASQGVKSGAGAYYYFFQAVNENEEPFTTAGAVRCSVYNRGANESGTLYLAHTTNQLSVNGAFSLPLASNDNGIIHWYSTSNVPVNLKCFTQYGDYAYKNGFTISTHKVKIDTAGAYKISRFPYTTNAAPTSTGIIIPAGALVTDVAVEVVTGVGAVPTDAHIDVGFAGNHTVAVRNALVRNMKINDRGFFLAHSQAFGGSTPTNAQGTHRGTALTHTYTTGANSVMNIDRNYMVHVSSGLEVTYNTSAAPAGIGGHVYIFWRMLHVGYNAQGQN